MKQLRPARGIHGSFEMIIANLKQLLESRRKKDHLAARVRLRSGIRIAKAR